MDYRRKFLTGLGLILILLVGKISIITENNVEKPEINPLTFENDICTIYDNLSVINSMLFEKEYKPLIVIIADKFIDGINRVRNLSESKRILNDAGIQNNPYYSLLYQTVSENIYLFQANDTYYFVYPVDFQDNFLTIYFQWKLLHNNLGIIFHFFDVKKEFPFFDDIFIPLQPSCTNCPLVKYINEKLQKGESFSELFELRKQLFREQKTKNLTFTPFDNDYICTWMGFNNNSQSSRSLMRFNSLLEQIQNNSANVEKSKRRRTVERSLSCFQSRYLYFRISEHYVQNFLITNGYLNWINRTISSLRGNDVSYGGLCENKHRIEILKFFCFMKDISDVTSHYIPAWTEALKKLVTKPLSIILKWYNLARYFYTDEYFIIVDLIVSIINTIFRRVLEESKRLYDKLNNTNEKRNILSRITDYKYETSYITICTIYEHWKTIDDLVLEVKSNRLVIIVADDMRTGIATVNKIKTSRVVPKVRREDLHYSEQFLYDVIMKNIYLVQSNDTYYYIYPTTTKRQGNPLIGYFEYKMIKDYSNVVFYFVKFERYFSLGKKSDPYNNNLVISALPNYCDKSSGNCKTRFINPAYLIKVHQDFFKRFPKYFSLCTSFYSKLQKFVNNHNSDYKNRDYVEYSKTFYDFVKQQQNSYDTNYLFNSLPCLSSRNLNNRSDINFSMTGLNDVLVFKNLINSAYKNITSINERNNTNLASLCSKKEIFKFLKFFCFLKINYIEGMLKVIDQKSYKISYMKSIVQNEKNTVTEYLLKTKDWIEELLSMQHFDYMYNEIQLFIKSDTLYSEIPKIFLNGTDLSNKIYSIVKNKTISSTCNKS